MSAPISMADSSVNAPLTALNAPIAYMRAHCHHPDLLERFLAHAENLELQVNVADGGGSDPENGTERWHNYRVPNNANSEPEFNDYPLRFNFARRVECIGATGWDWRNRRSRWVGFDFDSIVNHAAGLAPAALQCVLEAIQGLPYVEIRRSTSGNGFHVYVRVDAPTRNHTEHAALAKIVLAQMSKDAGVDLGASVDCYGAVLWLWHRKATPENHGFELVKAATADFVVPTSWNPEPDWDEFARAFPKAQMLARHWRIVDAVKDAGYIAEWDSEHHCVRTHTKGLELVHRAKELPGAFETISDGGNPGKHNCFAYPIKGGGFKVVRYGHRPNEAETWEQGDRWTTCLFAVEPEDVAKIKEKSTRINASDPTSLAEYHLERTQHEAERTLVFIKGQLFSWGDGVYRPVETAAYSPFVSESIRKARKEVGSVLPVKRSHIGDTLAQIHDLAKVKSEDDMGPFWLGESDWKAEDVIVFSNGLLNVERWLKNEPDHFRPHTPRLFVRNKLGFAYDPEATEPEQWHSFLCSIWADPQMKLLLQMWLGYCMTADCSLHKFLLMIGAPRGGKSTLAKVMKLMVGAENYTAPRYAGLTKEHGLAPLVGKRLAVFGDQAVVKHSEMVELAGLLKGLSADDDYIVNPKHSKQFSTNLKIKIVIQSNADLVFPEDSNALKARQLFLVFSKSFAGKEDFQLFDKLKTEASGIAQWALDGLRKLRENGNQFVEPEASKKLADETHSKSNPVGEFVKECCIVSESKQCRKEELHRAYLRWASENDAETIDQLTFGRRLLSNCRTVNGKLREPTGDRKSIYIGIGVK